MSDKQSGQDLACWIAQLLDRKGGKQISVLDVRNLSSFTDFLIIVTGTSSKHIETLIQSPVSELKQGGFPALSIEGQGTLWVVADFGDVVVHVFDEATRSYYHLEELWSQAPRIDWEPKKTLVSHIAL